MPATQRSTAPSSLGLSDCESTLLQSPCERGRHSTYWQYKLQSWRLASEGMAWRSFRLGPYVILYLTFFVLFNVFLLTCVVEVWDAQRTDVVAGKHGRLGRFYLSVDQWRLGSPTAPNVDLDSEITDISPYLAHKVPVEPQQYLYFQSTELNCSSLGNLKEEEFLGSGWTKSVYKAVYKGTPVAVKTVNIHGHDVTECLKLNKTLAECYRKSAAKIIKELILLKELEHHTVIKVLGYCIPNREFSLDNWSGFVAIVTELGEPIDLIKLLQLAWEERLKICLDVAELLHHLAHSPLGSLIMNDFRRQQFIMVNNSVKLSDVDDVGIQEPTCTADHQCTIKSTVANISVKVECLTSGCHGFNEKQNIFNAGRQFTTFLLPHGAPMNLKSSVNKLVDAYTYVLWDSDKLLKVTRNLVDSFISGSYLGKRKSFDRDFIRMSGYDTPHDYHCVSSMTTDTCIMSVFDEDEAKEMCFQDDKCKAFVITSSKTWTGRSLVHFKTDAKVRQMNSETNLFIRVS